MITLRLAIGTSLLVLAAGCGGYEGDHPPVGGPGELPTTQQTTAFPQVPEAQPTQQATAPTSTQESTLAVPAPTKKESTSGAVCTLIGKLNTVTVRAADKIRKNVTSLRVTLTQGTTSATAWTPIDPDNRHGMPLVRGVLIAAGSYTFVLGGDGKPQTALPGAWNGSKPARLFIEALAGDGRTIYQQTRTFAFGKSYPNGKKCDRTPALSFITELTAKDQFGPLPRS